MRACIVFAFVTCATWAQVRMISHVTSATGGFTTRIWVYNDSQNIQSFTLTAFDTSGDQLATSGEEIAGKTARLFSIQELFGEMAVSHFTIATSDRDTHVNVSYAFQAGRGSPAQVGESSQSKQTWRVLQGDWEVVFDGLAIVNVGPIPANVIVSQISATGTTTETQTIAEALSPMGKALYVIGGPQGSEFTPRPNSYYEISSSEPVIITALRGTPPTSDVGYLWENQPLLDHPYSGQRLYLSHVTRSDGGFTSQISLQNTSDSTSTLTFIPYLQDGTRLPRRHLQVTSNSFRAFAPHQIFGQGDISHAIIERDNAEVRVCVSYQASSGPGSPAQVCADHRFSTTWLLYPGNWGVVFDGFAVVNLSMEAADIYVQQLIDRDGVREVLDCQLAVSSLPSLGKGLFVLGGPNGGPFQEVAGSYFKVYATLPVSMVALRGTVPGSSLGILWQNGAINLHEMEITENPLCQDEAVGVFIRPPGAVEYGRRMQPTAGKIADNNIGLEVFNSRQEDVRITGSYAIDVEGKTLRNPFDEVVPAGQERHIARGYISVDNVDTCSLVLSFNTLTHFDTTTHREDFFVWGHVGPGSAAGNQLWGDYFYLDQANGFAQGDSLVHIEPQSNRCIANTYGWNYRLSTGLLGGFYRVQVSRDHSAYGYTFYGRYTTPRKRAGHPLDDWLPCGPIENGVVLCPPNEIAPPEGTPYLILYATYRDVIPMSDPELRYQYGFVFDSDDNPNNNWVPHPNYPDDYFKDTDLWYVAEYSPALGWVFRINSVKTGSIEAIPSGARLVIVDNAMILRVPLNEFESQTPKYRLTAFAHSGDFGANGDWSADVDPDTDEPLLTVTRE